MPSVARMGDSCTGHGCYPPRSNVAGSNNVLVNNLGAHRVGDAYSSHGCGICIPHGAVQAAGSSTVNVNGLPLARIGDSVSCGGAVATGSSNVIAN